MNMTQFDQFSESHGISIEDIGVYDRAFARADAFSAISLLQNCDLAILGGDVYARVGSTIKSAYDSWYCDPDTRETNREYLARSWQTAREYVENYPEPPDFEPLFVFVLMNA